MASSLDIQRVPRGLSDVLNIFGGETPKKLADAVIGNLDLLQFYGLSQRSVLETTTAAQTEGTSAGPTLPQNWCVLFGATMAVTKTATMTALRFSLAVRRPQTFVFVSESGDGGPFGATETGVVRCCFVPPTPWLLPPGSQVVGALDILGTDATAATVVTVELGILG